VGGWILAGFGSLFLIAAVALVVVHLTQRGKDGYYTSSTVQVAAPGYAITAKGLQIANLPSATSDVIGQLRVSARSNNGRAPFVGMASQKALNGYLAGVVRNQVRVSQWQHGDVPDASWQGASRSAGIRRLLARGWQRKRASDRHVEGQGGRLDDRLDERERLTRHQRGRDGGCEDQPCALDRPRLPASRTDLWRSGQRDAGAQPATMTNGPSGEYLLRSRC
jgi:hypothetical protein